MGDPQNHTWWEEIYNSIGKMLVWLMYISIGVMAKLAFDSRNGQLTKKQIAVKSVLSIFTGYIAAVLCENMNYEHWAKLIVPVSTLLGETVVLYFMTHWKNFVDKFLPPFFKDLGEKKNKK